MKKRETIKEEKGIFALQTEHTTVQIATICLFAMDISPTVSSRFIFTPILSNCSFAIVFTFFQFIIL